MTDLTYTVDGVEVHNNFGSMNVEFAIDGNYNGTNVNLHHIHADGTDTSNKDVVADNMLTTSVSDLSTFAIENLDTAPVVNPTNITSTGDAYFVLIMMLVVLASLSGVVVLKKKKH